MRILFLVHGHESLSVGGAENAAFSLFREAQEYSGVQAWILAAVHTSKGLLAHGELRSMDHSDHEYLIGTCCDWFQFANPHVSSMRRSLKRLIDHIKPDIIHIQHYIHFGIDIIPLLQSICPSIKIVLTLHEYLGLCMNNGQMVTTSQLKLCDKATPLACSICFPEHSTASFFLRHQFIKNIIESCDALISPSHFLVDTYRECGISHSRFLIIENGLPSVLTERPASEERSDLSPKKYNRFAYFGQLNEYKGCLLLLNAIRLLQDEGITSFSLNVYGANLEGQSREFQNKFSSAFSKVSDLVKLCGSYSQSELPRLIEAIDWVVVPSIWWENSPVVIQEAFYFRKPVLASNIGGMREKVDGVGGLTFTARSEFALADTIRHAIGNASLHQNLVAQIPPPQTAHQCLLAHLSLYGQLLQEQEASTQSLAIAETNHQHATPI